MVIENPGFRGGRRYVIRWIATSPEKNSGVRPWLNELGDEEIGGIVVFAKRRQRLEQIIDLANLVVELLPLAWIKTKVFIVATHVMTDVKYNQFARIFRVEAIEVVNYFLHCAAVAT